MKRVIKTHFNLTLHFPRLLKISMNPAICMLMDMPCFKCVMWLMTLYQEDCLSLALSQKNNQNVLLMFLIILSIAQNCLLIMENVLTGSSVWKWFKETDSDKSSFGCYSEIVRFISSRYSPLQLQEVGVLLLSRKTRELHAPSGFYTGCHFEWSFSADVLIRHSPLCVMTPEKAECQSVVLSAYIKASTQTFS